MNKIDEQNALKFTEYLIKLYFNKRDSAALLDGMTENISWIGTGENEFVHTSSEAALALTQDIGEYPGTFTIENTVLTYLPLFDNACIIYGSITAIPSDETLSEEDLRLSVVLTQTGDALKLAHLHFSHADVSQEQGHYFVRRSTKKDNESLRLALSMRERQLANLTHNIPGGAHQCANDPNLTLLSMSDGFLSMFGYTKEEIETLFDNQFINMVYPGDRAELLSITHHQLSHGSDIELEYRVLCKTGEPMWVLDKGRLMDDGKGGRCFYCLLIEINERQRQQEELRLSLERHKVIMDQATDIIFEWDIRKDTLSFSSNFYKKFGYNAVESHISQNIPISQNLHPDDMSAFTTIMRDTASGSPYSETEFRIQNSEGKYLWCRIRATAQFDADGRPIKAIGVILDIDAEKRQKQALIDQAQRDALTGLYNKTAVQALIEQQMSRHLTSELQALMIMDVDHFKYVNDTYGHLCGDTVLSEIATILKNCTRVGDLVGRIGGDEFLIYLPDIVDQNAALKKAEQLLKAIQVIKPDSVSAPITCSIGLAVFPAGKIDYKTFCLHADQALYQQKNGGRRGVTLFDIEEDTGTFCSDSFPSAICDNITSDEDSVSDSELSQYAFRSLYAAPDIEIAINRLLEIIGRSFDVSRVYIFENDEGGNSCSNTFEWCNENVLPQIDKLQSVPYTDSLSCYEERFSENGMFYCHTIEELPPDMYNLLKPQEICSMLQCAMLDEGNFVGYVGFDECRENRKWSSHQITSFKLTADVLSTFVIKLRQKQKLTKKD